MNDGHNMLSRWHGLCMHHVLILWTSHTGKLQKRVGTIMILAVPGQLSASSMQYSACGRLLTVKDKPASTYSIQSIPLLLLSISPGLDCHECHTGTSNRHGRLICHSSRILSMLAIDHMLSVWSAGLHSVEKQP